MNTKEFNGRILVRIPSELHKNATECSADLNISLNEFITESIKERVGKIVSTKGSFERVVIGEQKLKDLREAVIVTQHPWFMEIFNKYRIYFFNPAIGKITPMQYILCYETTKTEEDGTVNQNKRHIGKWGKVKEILFNIEAKDYINVPELIPLVNDNKFWDEVKSWDITNVVILDEIGDINSPLPLNDHLLAKYLINKTTTLPKLRNAVVIDDLF